MLHCSSADSTVGLPKAHSVVIARSCQDDGVTAHCAWSGVHCLMAGKNEACTGPKADRLGPKVKTSGEKRCMHVHTHTTVGTYAHYSGYYHFEDKKNQSVYLLPARSFGFTRTVETLPACSQQEAVTSTGQSPRLRAPQG